MSGYQKGKSQEYADLLKVNRGEAGAKAGELSELVIEEMIREFCVPGELAVDCGAADGRMTRIMRGAVGDSGKVVAFEPLPEQFGRLEDEFSSSNVTVVNACVSHRLEENVTFYHAKDRRWVSSLSPVGLEDHDVQELSVPVTTIDETLSKVITGSSGPRAGFIKLDIEGAEFRALQGASHTITEHRPVIVFENGLEHSAKKFGYSQSDFFGFFDSLGYRLIDIFGGAQVQQVWPSGSTRAWNFVAFDKSLYPDMGEYCLNTALNIAENYGKKSVSQKLRGLVRRIAGAK